MKTIYKSDFHLTYISFDILKKNIFTYNPVIIKYSLSRYLNIHVNTNIFLVKTFVKI